MSQTVLEKAIEELKALKETLAIDYLRTHCVTIEEPLDGYDGCTKYRTVWRESDQEIAEMEAERVLQEAYNSINL